MIDMNFKLVPVSVSLITHLHWASSPIQTTELEVPNIPQCPEKGNHMVTFDPTDLYIDRDDFKEVIVHILFVCVDLQHYSRICFHASNYYPKAEPWPRGNSSPLVCVSVCLFVCVFWVSSSGCSSTAFTAWIASTQPSYNSGRFWWSFVG